MPLSATQKSGVDFYVRGVQNLLRDGSPEEAARILQRLLSTQEIPVVVDVSHSEASASHRITGSITDILPNHSKEGKMLLLVRETSRNF